ncbi:hypothetical protein ACQR2W_05330 [Clostridium perfringens]
MNLNKGTSYKLITDICEFNDSEGMFKFINIGEIDNNKSISFKI